MFLNGNETVLESTAITDKRKITQSPSEHGQKNALVWFTF